MKARNVPVVVLVLVLLGCGSALAGEKVFRLKNGRTLVGEIVEEKGDAYIVKTKGGGSAVLRKDAVKSLEEPLPPATAPVSTKATAAARAPHLASAAEMAAVKDSLASYAALEAGTKRAARAKELVEKHGLAPFATLLLGRTSAPAAELDAALEVVVGEKAAAEPYLAKVLEALGPKEELPRRLQAAFEAVAKEFGR